MTLIEVIVAISIMAIVATAATALTITGISSSAVLQRREIAVTVANSAMETASAAPAATTSYSNSQYSQLVSGRSAAEVSSSWPADGGTVSGIKNTYQAWDPSPGGNGGEAVPLSISVMRSGTTYTAKTYIGTCFQPTSGGDCVRVGGAGSIAPQTVPSGYSSLLRVIVVVSWTAGASCKPTACQYQTSSLVDAHPDQEWNSNG
jgi:prepilin-type N-terminal cleavage/methylation domain-containing protein